MDCHGAQCPITIFTKYSFFSACCFVRDVRGQRHLLCEPNKHGSVEEDPAEAAAAARSERVVLLAPGPSVEFLVNYGQETQLIVFGDQETERRWGQLEQEL